MLSGNKEKTNYFIKDLSYRKGFYDPVISAQCYVAVLTCVFNMIPVNMQISDFLNVFYVYYAKYLTGNCIINTYLMSLIFKCFFFTLKNIDLLLCKSLFKSIAIQYKIVQTNLAYCYLIKKIFMFILS